MDRSVSSDSIVMLPTPTSAPSHAHVIPAAATGPEIVCLAAGSISGHGLHLSQLLKSATWGKTTEGGLAMTTERSTA